MTAPPPQREFIPPLSANATLAQLSESASQHREVIKRTSSSVLYTSLGCLFLTCNTSVRRELSSLNLQIFPCLFFLKLNECQQSAVSYSLIHSSLRVTKSHALCRLVHNWIYAHACFKSRRLLWVLLLISLLWGKKKCVTGASRLFSPHQPPRWTFPLFPSTVGERWVLCRKPGSTRWH